MEARYAELVGRLNEIADLERVSTLLGWDQQAVMPTAGAEARSHQRATVRKLTHRLFTDDAIGRLLDELEPWGAELPYDSDESSLLRVVRREFEKERRVPAELAAEMSAAASRAHEAWVDARAHSNFAMFRPSLEESIELRRRYIACFEQRADPYDLLLEDFEPGMTAAEVAGVFARLCDELVPLIAAIGEQATPADTAVLHGHFPIASQERVVRSLLEAIGFDSEAWRLDTVVHPFAISLWPTDVRVTTRYDAAFLAPAIFGALHEFGHGLYEAGIPAALARTPLGRPTSLGLHESQSRLWENLVGRSRPFWNRFYPLVRDAFPDALAATDARAFHAAVNCVRPSLIRVEADEVTYNLHIVLRFELERALVDGSLAPADLPEAWNESMRRYLGVDVPDDAHGVLQDPHWCFGFGYFPTYSLGNVISAQLWQRILIDLPEIERQIGRGELAPLREWLRAHVHELGNRFTMQETLERVVGARLDPGPYLEYLRTKLGSFYAL